MKTQLTMRRLATTLGLALVLAVPIMAPTTSSAATGSAATTEALTVDLASTTGPATGVGDDSATSGTDVLTYGSGWGTATGVSDLYGGTAHWSSTAGAGTTLTFTGTTATVHGVRDTDQGIAGYSVDGGAPVTVDGYRASRSAESPLFTAAGLPSGTHTVTVTVTGTRNTASSNDIVALDYADIS